MKITTEETKFDKDGYQLLPKNFTEKKFEFKEVFEDGDWKIFERKGEDDSVPHFELVKLYKSEEYQIAGNVIPKKWNYPSSESWGVSGFTLLTKDRAFAKLEELKNRREESIEEKQTSKNNRSNFILPATKKFTLKDILKLNTLSYPSLVNKIKEMVENSELEICGENKNQRGRPSKIYKKT